MIMAPAATVPLMARRRLSVAVAGLILAFAAVGGQLVRLGAKGYQTGPRLALTEPLTQTFARPDIVDRKGRLLATDILAPSLFADPALIVDVDEVVDRLVETFPDLNPGELRRALSDRTRRFVWIRRGLPPRVAQQVHDLGLPGLTFRYEPRRTYPAGTLAGHVLGFVGVDNQGLAGIERLIDERRAVEPTLGAGGFAKEPMRLSIDLGIQHGLETELADAMARYRAKGAAGVVLDVTTGEVMASASLPSVDPLLRAVQGPEEARIDKINGGTYELGSIFKAVTIAMAIDGGLAKLESVYDVRKPLTVGRYTIRDLHPQGRPLTVREIFVHSSNVGAGMLAEQAGSDRQRAFLERLGLLSPMRTELGPVAAPSLPKHWGPTETITISYGHGLAVAPLQFAAAAAALVNGGRAVQPTFLAGAGAPGEPVVSAATSAQLRELMRRNVIAPKGTGRRADVDSLEVGGKTGTAEIAGVGGYRDKAVISSFVAAFPMSAPRYVVLMMVFEPTPTGESDGQITAGLTAAPATGRLIARIAPLLDLPTAK